MAQERPSQQAPDANASDPITSIWRTKDQWVLAVADERSSISTGPPSTSDTVSIYDCGREELEEQVEVLKADSALLPLTGSAWRAMELAGFSRSQWLSERKGPRKIGAAFQSSMSDFARFLQNFSGIVSIAQAADQRYGGLAYGTLSLMLSIFVHKTQWEEALDSGFEQLNFELPRLQTLHDLAREGCENKRLHELLMSTCALVLTFARETTEYYSSKWRRVKDTLKSDQVKQKTLTDIRKNLQEVRYECDIIMLARITSLHQKVQALSLQLEATHTEVTKTGHEVSTTRAELQDHTRQMARARTSLDASHLADLRAALDIKDPSSPKSTHTNLRDYQSLLNYAFSSTVVYTRHSCPVEVSMDLLQADSDFSMWWNSETSCLFLAGGKNILEGPSTLNWLSFGVVVFVDELRKQGRNVAFYLAQVTWSANLRNRPRVRQVMSSLLYQIAEIHHDLLRAKSDEIKRVVNSAAWQSDETDQILEAAHALCLELLAAVSPEDEIVIVIDRIDQCAWHEHDKGRSEHEIVHAVESLVGIAAKAHCRIKILVTVDASGPKVKLERLNSLLMLPKKERKALLLKSNWEQAVQEVATIV